MKAALEVIGRFADREATEADLDIVYRAYGPNSLIAFGRGDPHCFAKYACGCRQFGSNAVQADLLREIFGNPFCPVVFDPAWQVPDVIELARFIYDEHAFDRMPVLADALEDAGCDNADLLKHCLEPGRHVRGCWVVDLISGRS